MPRVAYEWPKLERNINKTYQYPTTYKCLVSVPGYLNIPVVNMWKSNYDLTFYLQWSKLPHKKVNINFLRKVSVK